MNSSNYAFFESFKKMFSQIFNVSWLSNSKKIFQDAKITIIMIFQFRDAKITIIMLLQINARNKTSKIRHLQNLLISRNFHAKRESYVRNKNSKSSKNCDSNFVKQFDHRSLNDYEKNQSQSFYNSINDTFNKLKFSIEIYRIRTIE